RKAQKTPWSPLPLRLRDRTLLPGPPAPRSAPAQRPRRAALLRPVERGVGGDQPHLWLRTSAQALQRLDPPVVLRVQHPLHTDGEQPPAALPQPAPRLRPDRPGRLLQRPNALASPTAAQQRHD